MKKVMRKYLYVLTAAMSAAILFSCSKEVDVINTNDSTEPGKTVTLTITASHDNGTRTYLDGDSVKWSESNETLAVFEENGTDVAKSTSKAGVTTDGGTTMTFATQLETATGSDFTYYAFYPSSAWSSNKTPSSIAINTPATQTPLATSFDPAADLLIAKPVETASQATSLSMRFARAIAVGKMTIKNLQSSEKVIQVKFSAKIGSNDVSVAGRTPFDLGTAEPADVYGKNVSEKSIILDYNNLNLTANSSMDAFFTCYPFELGAGDSFTVEVKTPTNTFVRTVTIPDNRSLAFKAGELSTFSVDMGSVSGTANAVNLCYAYLTAEEFHEAGGTNSYGNVTVEKEHGDKWETYAAYNSNSISIRNNSSTNDSYVKLPEFTDNISSVIVTLGSAIASGKTLTLESSKTDNTSSIGSLTTVADQTTYTFDLSGTSVKTAYLRSSGAQALVSKIEVFAGTDNRPATQAGPSSVSATVDAETPNTINVTWTAASGATGYEVTLTPASGDPITQSVASTVTTASFSGLAYSTSYTPSVIALGDLYLVKANSASVPGEAVTTGDATIAFTNIADLNALLNSESADYTGTLTNAVVSFVPQSNTAIIKDGTGSILYYKSGHGLKQGQTFTGTVTVTAIKYNNLYSEITAMDATFTGAGSAVDPESITLNDLVGHFSTWQNAYVQVPNLTVSSVVNGKNINVTDGTNTYVVYYNPGSSTCLQGDVITAKGTVTKYGEADQIKVWAADDLVITSYVDRTISFTQPSVNGCSFTVNDGAYSISSGTSVAYGTTVTLSATVGDGYTFGGWIVAGATVENASATTTTFTMGHEAVTISAAFNNGEGPQSVTYQHVFNAKPSVGNNVSLSNVNWSISATSLGNYNSGNYAGVQIGTSTKNGSITLTSSSSWSYQNKTKITEVRLWLNLGGTSVTPTVTIGGKAATSDGTTVVKNSSAGTDWTKTTKVTFTPASDGNTGVIVINVETVKAGYICALEIDCE